MWFVKLDNGFDVGIFDEKHKLMCEDASDGHRALSIEYRVNGKYNDLVSIGFAPGQATPAAAANDEDDDTPF